MCNFSQYVKDEGKFEANLNSIKNLMKNLNLDVITAMKALEFDEKDFPSYLKALNMI